MTRVGSDRPRELEAVELWHVDVGHDEVERLVRIEPIERLASVARRFDAIARSLEDAHWSSRTASESSTPLRDEGLTHVAVLTQLQSLQVGDTAITDAGVLNLQTLKDLKFLAMSRTFVTDDGVGAFLKVLPGVMIPSRLRREPEGQKEAAPTGKPNG